MIIGALVRGEQPDAPRKKEIKKKNPKDFLHRFHKRRTGRERQLFTTHLKASTQYKVLFYMPVSPNTMKMFDTFCFSLLLLLSIYKYRSMDVLLSMNCLFYYLSYRQIYIL